MMGQQTTTNEYGFTFNANKVCLNPKTPLDMDEKTWRCRIKVARLAKDKWCYGYDADMKYGNFAGLGCPCSDCKRDNVETEREAVELAIRGLLEFARHYKVKPMYEAVEHFKMPRNEYVQLNLFE